ncbi:transcriptional antiterminator [Desulfonema ishimotonii]|uniref:Transcriptional antiterminator n=1 Tax=Desulfonema ishimotonii TaxID=45657 RepID=A0A401FQU1_9BACT|nr:UpxY family transcription antiterminator [Desulfonema ishimotonii]GBC59338.1 transcriptional antiterminator [Desulfonema ishimotonii]
MTQDSLIRAWYVLHTRSRFENVVYENLSRKSLETFLPRIRVLSRRKDRKKFIRVPLFPGYIFVRTDLDPNEHLEIVKTVGAVRLIGTNLRPVPVPDEAIESLKIMVASEEGIETGTRFSRGDRVMVVGGPFAGVVGIFSNYKGMSRVIVNIEVLGQFASAEVNEADVEIVPGI